jgi:hypothetical protein
MKMTSSVRNIIALLAVIAISMASGVFAYSNPKTVLAASNAAITSMSIIFGLSLSLITLASTQTSISEEVIPKKQVRRGIQADLDWENNRIIFRQKLAVCILLLAVFLGIIFIGSATYAPESSIHAIIGSTFAFFTSISFAISFVLPFSISSTIRRNRRFRVD